MMEDNEVVEFGGMSRVSLYEQSQRCRQVSGIQNDRWLLLRRSVDRTHFMDFQCETSASKFLWPSVDGRVDGASVYQKKYQSNSNHRFGSSS